MLAERPAATFDRLNPVTGEVATTAPAASVADANAACEAAATAFPVWSAMGPNARRAMLNKAADALEVKAPQFIEAMMGEIGATRGWAGFNLMLAAGILRGARQSSGTRKNALLANRVRLSNRASIQISAAWAPSRHADRVFCARRHMPTICWAPTPIKYILRRFHFCVCPIFLFGAKFKSARVHVAHSECRPIIAPQAFGNRVQPVMGDDLRQTVHSL